MTLRAVVHDGLIVVNTHGALADGTTVRIVASSGASDRASAKLKAKSKKKAAARTKSRAGSRRTPRTPRTPGYGIWSDRTDLGSPEHAVDRLRALTRRRRIA